MAEVIIAWWTKGSRFEPSVSFRKSEGIRVPSSSINGDNRDGFIRIIQAVRQLFFESMLSPKFSNNEIYLKILDHILIF